MASAQILTNGKALYAYNGTEWVPLNTAGNLVNSTRWQKTTTAAQTSLSGNDDYGDSLIYTPGYEQLYLNGVLLARDVDYTATNGTTITGLAPLTAGHIIEVIAYNNINVGNTYTQAQIDSKVANTFERWVDTLSASATVLSGLDDNSNTLSYTPGLEQVYVNGILLLPSEYTATSGSSIVLSEAAVASDVIQVYALKNFRVPNTYTILQTDDQFLTKTSASSTYLSQSSASSIYQTQAANGLVLISSSSYSSTGNINIDSCFSGNYNNYKISFNIVPGTSDALIYMRLRSGGTTNTSSNYNQYRVNYSGSITVSRGQTTFWNLYDTRGTDNFSPLNIELQNPFNSLYTSGYYENVYAPEVSTLSGNHAILGMSVTTSYDGINLYASTGNISGTVQIYGYKK